MTEFFRSKWTLSSAACASLIPASAAERLALELSSCATAVSRSDIEM